jgi:hypothetical protein
VVIFTSFFKVKKSLKSHKTAKIRFFSYFFACSWKDPDPGGPKTYGYYKSGYETLDLTNDGVTIQTFKCKKVPDRSNTTIT